MNYAPIADKTLWDSLGNRCRVTMHYVGLPSVYTDKFEVYFQEFNDSVPIRHMGSLAAMNHRVEHWLASKKAAGFTEHAPIDNPNAVRV